MTPMDAPVGIMLAIPVLLILIAVIVGAVALLVHLLRKAKK